MFAAKRLLSTISRFRAARSGWVVLAFVLLTAAVVPAEAGIIVAQNGSSGLSVHDERGGSSPVAGSDSRDEAQHDLSGEGALPTGAGSSSGGTAGAGGVVAILPQPCGLSASVFSAGLSEERALQLPASPFFDHLRPPQR